MSDVWLGNAFQLPYNVACRDNPAYELPMEETRFLELNRASNESSSRTPTHISSLSLFTQMIKLVAIFVDISAFNRNSTPPQTPISDLGDNMIVDRLTERLDIWQQDLAPQLQDTQENLILYGVTGLGGMFVAVYLGYYHYGQVLYYRYLHEDSFDQGNIHARYYADKCKWHSTALCELLYRAYSTPGCEVYYAMVGHVLAIASTVQLHILLFSADVKETNAARRRLERNFEILTKLQSFWPNLDLCFERFQEFHAACQRSAESSFRMDSWMLRFLFEFTKPIGRKEEGVGASEPGQWSMQDFLLTPLYATNLGNPP